MAVLNELVRGLDKVDVGRKEDRVVHELPSERYMHATVQLGVDPGQPVCYS